MGAGSLRRKQEQCPNATGNAHQHRPGSPMEHFKERYIISKLRLVVTAIVYNIILRLWMKAINATNRGDGVFHQLKAF